MPAKAKARGEDPIGELRKAHSKAAKEADKVLETALAAIKKQHGGDAFVSLSGDVAPVSCVSTGFPALDDVLSGEANAGKSVAGTGLGMPMGRIIELTGPEAAGKSTLVLHLIKAFQGAGHRCAYIDVEHGSDPQYMHTIGVDLASLLFSQPTSAEQALSIVEELCKVGAAKLVVVDSVAALLPIDEQEKGLMDTTVAMQARLMSKHLRRTAGIASKNSVTVVFVNQIRQKIGGFGYGPQETSPGGMALRFYASIRLDIRRIKTLKKGARSIGIRSRIKCVKNKVSAPFREAFAEIHFGQGIMGVALEDGVPAGKDLVEDKEE